MLRGSVYIIHTICLRAFNKMHDTTLFYSTSYSVEKRERSAESFVFSTNYSETPDAIPQLFVMKNCAYETVMRSIFLMEINAIIFSSNDPI